MSKVVKLLGALPADFENNGLDALAASLIEHPEQIRTALVWFDVHHKTDVTDSAEVVPSVRIRKIEPLGNAGEMEDAVKELWFKAEQARTGKTPLPFGEVREIDEEPDGEAVDA